MLRRLPYWALGLFSLVVLSLNTIFWAFPLLFVALVKALIPLEGWRTGCDRLLHRFGQYWVGLNNRGLHLTKNIRWDAQGLEGLSPANWYLVVANHQSWVDIVVLQKIFHRRAPLLKFFLKKELIWVPVLGILWWALDFPFMRRSSSIHKDFETTRKACEKFRSAPVSVMNFVEGTRFTTEKRVTQESPFNHLLKPKAAGIALVLGTMGTQLRSILDVTIIYPRGTVEIWEFLCSRTIEIKVRVKEIAVTEDLIGDYLKDRTYRRRFNDWLNTLWSEKDGLIEAESASPVITVRT